MSGRLRRLPTLLACALAGASGIAVAGPAPAPTAPAAATPTAPTAGAAPASTAQGAATAPATADAPKTPIAPMAIPDAPPNAPITPVASGPAGPDPQAEAAALAGATPGAAKAGTEPLAQSVTRGDEVFARIRRNLGSPVCTGGGNSERWRRRYASNPAMFANRVEQILPLLDFVSTEVERVGLPSEFVFIPLVESWYKPDAMNASGPAGMWQMIGSTAKNHGIHITSGYDGRLSPVESTRAALSYLKVLHGMFGNWQATVMAYNAGEGRMLQAFKRARSRETSGDQRRPHGLSNITYDYVAKLQALSCLVSQPERSGLRLPRASRFVPLAAVLMEPGVGSIEQFASRRGRNAAELRRLNPGFKAGRVVDGVPRLVLMPLGVPQGDVARAGETALAAVPAPSPSPALASIELAAPGAAAVVATLPNTTRLAVGTPLPATADVRGDAPQAPTLETVSPRPVAVAVANRAAGTASAPATTAGALAAPTAATGAAPAATPSGAGGAAEVSAGDAAKAAATTHRVVAGESLWTIARLYQLSVEDLRELNRLERRDVVHPGDTLKLAP